MPRVVRRDKCVWNERSKLSRQSRLDIASKVFRSSAVGFPPDQALWPCVQCHQQSDFLPSRFEPNRPQGCCLLSTKTDLLLALCLACRSDPLNWYFMTPHQGVIPGRDYTMALVIRKEIGYGMSTNLMTD